MFMRCAINNLLDQSLSLTALLNWDLSTQANKSKIARVFQIDGSGIALYKSLPVPYYMSRIDFLPETDYHRRVDNMALIA